MTIVTDRQIDRDSKDVGVQCGTYAGYQRHGRTGTQRCDPCRNAAKEYARHNRTNPDVKTRERFLASARERALSALAREYPVRYRELYAAEVAAGPAPAHGPALYDEGCRCQICELGNDWRLGRKWAGAA